ncbi:hypothetical protein FIBSPDRAFT_936020 [Athelia psychrophila]|uniref:Uncharacterized protein n=1 Tax=Athelia psychrophila TaxID=1759441 RepID=A0A166CUE4_9AGAM|nr:hypothetical protein FIBSPDRAFT_936020 [Fibularhizoctonia sp. CBS 109695]
MNRTMDDLSLSAQRRQRPAGSGDLLSLAGTGASRGSPGPAHLDLRAQFRYVQPQPFRHLGAVGSLQGFKNFNISDGGQRSRGIDSESARYRINQASNLGSGYAMTARCLSQEQRFHAKISLAAGSSAFEKKAYQSDNEGGGCPLGKDHENASWMENRIGKTASYLGKIRISWSRTSASGQERPGPTHVLKVCAIVTLQAGHRTLWQNGIWKTTPTRCSEFRHVVRVARLARQPDDKSLQVRRAPGHDFEEKVQTCETWSICNRLISPERSRQIVGRVGGVDRDHMSSCSVYAISSTFEASLVRGVVSEDTLMIISNGISRGHYERDRSSRVAKNTAASSSLKRWKPAGCPWGGSIDSSGAIDSTSSSDEDIFDIGQEV